MASYAELLQCAEDPTLLNKVRVAVVIAAERVRSDASPPPNQDDRLLWAKKVFESPDFYTKPMLWAVLAQNEAIAKAAILAATDAAVQTAVDAAVDVFT